MTPITVSYTHLDVYKRQLLALLVVCVLLFVFLKQKPHDEDSQLAIAPTESGEAVVETESIEASDVYKRQVLRWIPKVHLKSKIVPLLHSAGNGIPGLYGICLLYTSFIIGMLSSKCLLPLKQCVKVLKNIRHLHIVLFDMNTFGYAFRKAVATINI